MWIVAGPTSRRRGRWCIAPGRPGAVRWPALPTDLAPAASVALTVSGGAIEASSIDAYDEARADVFALLASALEGDLAVSFVSADVP